MGRWAASRGYPDMHEHAQKRATGLTQKQLEQQRRAGLWLRELRERRGLSQREVADAVGIEVYTVISQLEHGRGVIPQDRSPMFAEALGIEPREFERRLNVLIMNPRPH